MKSKRKSLAGVALLLALSAACSGTSSKQGGLMVVLSTDVSIPKDIDAIGLYITSAGTTIYSNTEPVQPGGNVRLPATLNIVASDDPRRTVRVRAVGFSKNVARVLRDVIVTVPQNRTAQLRVPLNFLSFGSGRGRSPLSLTSVSPLTEPTLSPLASFDPFTQLANTCGEGKTDVGGVCAALSIDVSKLEDYQPDTIFGGAAAPTTPDAVPGECFPIVPCFAEGTDLQVEPSTCSIALPTDAASAARFNVGLRTSGVGFKTSLGSIVVLDQDANAAFGEIGTARQAGGRLALPPGVCKKMAAETPADERVLGVVGSTLCVPKSKKVPLCDTASATNRPLAFGDAGLGDGGVVIKTELVATNLDTPRGLIAVDDKVYIATKGPKVVRLDVATQSLVHDLGTSGPPIGLAGGMRGGKPYFSVAISDPIAFQPADVAESGPVVPSLVGATIVDGVATGGGASYFALGTNAGGSVAFIDKTRNTEDPLPIPIENGSARATGIFADPVYGLLFVHSGSNAIYRCDNPPSSCRNNFQKALPNPKAGGRIRTIASAEDGRLVFAWVPDVSDRTGVLYRSTVAGLSAPPTALAENVDFVPTSGTYGGARIVGDNVYFADAEGLKVVSYKGGTPRLLAAKTREGVSDIAIAGGHVYWLEVGAELGTGTNGGLGTVYRRTLE